MYAKADYRYPLNDDWAIRLGAEFTDQRAVGAALVANAAGKKWVTQVGGARVQLIYRQLTLTGAFSITGSGNTIQNPWGTYPGFLSLIDAPAAQNFARANEKGWLIGAVLRLFGTGGGGARREPSTSRGARGLSIPKTRVRVPDQRGVQFKIEYRPPWLASTVLRGLGFTVRAAFYDQEDSRPTRSSDPRDPQLGVGHACARPWQSSEVARLVGQCGATRWTPPTGYGLCSLVCCSARLYDTAYAESPHHARVGHDWAAGAGRGRGGHPGFVAQNERTCHEWQGSILRSAIELQTSVLSTQLSLNL